MNQTFDTYAEAAAARDALTREHGGFWTVHECSTGTYGQPGYRLFFTVERVDFGFE